MQLRKDIDDAETDIYNMGQPEDHEGQADHMDAQQRQQQSDNQHRTQEEVP